jgi:hypothetical protein
VDVRDVGLRGKSDSETIDTFNHEVLRAAKKLGRIFRIVWQLLK